MHVPLFPDAAFFLWRELQRKRGLGLLHDAFESERGGREGEKTGGQAFLSVWTRVPRRRGIDLLSALVPVAVFMPREHVLAASPLPPPGMIAPHVLDITHGQPYFSIQISDIPFRFLNFLVEIFVPLENCQIDFIVRSIFFFRNYLKIRILAN